MVAPFYFRARESRERPMKVTGIKREDGGKDYQIRHEGETYLAVREANGRFNIQGVRGSLKQLKMAVESGDFTTKEVEARVVFKPQGTFDCVNPCAFLVAFWSAIPQPAKEECLRTLDSWGWLDEQGNPDMAQAKRELRRVSGHASP